MKILSLGTGNAFTQKNFNQSFLLESDGHRMLVDCGRNIPEALAYHKIDIKSIEDIYISHLHVDHIGGLEYIAFSRYDWANKPHKWSSPGCKVEYAPRLITDEELMRELWDTSLKGGLSCIEGLNSKLDTFFQPWPIQANGTFAWYGWNCRLIQQVHIMTGSVIQSTFGLWMDNGKTKIYFTTDSQHCSPRQVEIFYRDANLIFQDCEITDFVSGVHANYKQLAGYPEANSVVLPVEIRNKMWLSHYQDSYFDRKEEWDSKAEKDGFKGFLQKGQIIEL